MIRLIRNELKKIFSRAPLYIILIIAIAVGIFSNLMTKNFSGIFSDSYSSDLAKKSYEVQLQYAKEENDKEMIAEAESYIEAYDIAQKYEKESWQRYIVQNKLQEVIRNIKTSNDQAEKQKYQTEYDEILKDFEENNWRGFVEKELKEVNEEIKLAPDEATVENLNYRKQALEWRLEKDIPYGQSDLNAYLESWVTAKMQIKEFERNSNPSYEEKRSNQENIETVAVCEYAIENKINSNITEGGGAQLDFSLSENARSSLLDVFGSYGFFILLATVIIAGTIVSEEFNKGTIKLLLVRPYERTKILLAKFISCLIVLVMAFISVVLIQTVIGGIVFGFGSYADKLVMYNFNTNSLETLGTLQYLLMSAVMILPEYLLLMTLAFAISTIFTNSPMAIAIPCLGIVASEILNTLVMNYEKAKFLLYFVTPNWDLSIFAFGKLPTFKGITLPFSITICSVYFVVMLVASIICFKKKNIKNI